MIRALLWGRVIVMLAMICLMAHAMLKADWPQAIFWLISFEIQSLSWAKP